MPGVQFGQQIDMNGFKVTELAPGTAGTDAVNLSQLTAVSPQGFGQDIGDGVATTFSVVHNFGTLDVIVSVFRKSDNVEFTTDVTRVDANTVSVAFGSAPALNSYRVLVIPVP